MQELKSELDLPWMDALRIEFTLGYSVELTLQGIPRNMVRLSPLDTYHGEYFVHKWLLDDRIFWLGGQARSNADIFR